MSVEIEIFGFLAPTLLPVLVACAAVFVVVDLILARCGAYRFAWHPGLLRIGLFAVLFCSAALLVHR
ncbi:hypothetical protein GCM10027093_27410 [Paraburkholderia jirisanensis]